MLNSVEHEKSFITSGPEVAVTRTAAAQIDAAVFNYLS